MKGQRFTPEEDEIIRLHYPEGGAVLVLQFLSNRYAFQIVNRANYLEIKTAFKGTKQKLRDAMDIGINRKHNNASKNWLRKT